MPIPTYDRFIEPVLRFLAQRPIGAPAREVYEAAATVLGLSEADRKELLPSGTQEIYKNRAGWAHDRLKRKGLSTSPRRGFWQLSAAGSQWAQDHPAPLNDKQVDEIASVPRERVRSTPSTNGRGDTMESTTREQASPDERLELALAEIRASVADELLDTLKRVSPGYFESVVLDLLHRMGYGTSRADLRRVGGAGDGGIDGVISLDKLGLEKVYVQAKRWQNTVGRPEVQGFYGALAGQRARKGVFITTSSFSSQAEEFARSVEQIVLVDGQRLVELMIDHEVGVSLRPVRVPRLDGDYFDEEGV